MLSARCFSLNRLVVVTLPQVGINDKKKQALQYIFTFSPKPGIHFWSWGMSLAALHELNFSN
jgi:hypothetical protein